MRSSTLCALCQSKATAKRCLHAYTWHLCSAGTYTNEHMRQQGCGRISSFTSTAPSCVGPSLSALQQARAPALSRPHAPMCVYVCVCVCVCACKCIYVSVSGSMRAHACLCLCVGWQGECKSEQATFASCKLSPPNKLTANASSLLASQIDRSNLL